MPVLPIWRANTEADPRVFVDEWPDDDEFVSLISSSRLFLLKHRDDDRTSDVQVRMESGSRLQLPSSVFRQLEGGSALIADYNKRVRDSLSLARSSAPSSSISRLRELREKSVARRKNSSSRSRSSSSSSLASSKDDDDPDFVDDASKSHLSSILEEGFGSAAVSPARVAAPSPANDSGSLLLSRLSTVLIRLMEADLSLTCLDLRGWHWSLCFSSTHCNVQAP